jgi:outer membrane biosynthesis protein TonB
MPATDSTRTATRWSWCDAARSFASALAVATSVACVTTTSTAYLPTPGQPRLSVDDARDEVDALLRTECPRLVQAGKPSQEARVTVDVGPTGDVARARLTTSTGDEQIDKIFGGVAARLHFLPPEPGALKGPTAPGHLRMGYSCSANAAVVTIQLL